MRAHFISGAACSAKSHVGGNSKPGLELPLFFYARTPKTMCPAAPDPANSPAWQNRVPCFRSCSRQKGSAASAEALQQILVLSISPPGTGPGVQTPGLQFLRSPAALQGHGAVLQDPAQGNLLVRSGLVQVTDVDLGEHMIPVPLGGEQILHPVEVFGVGQVTVAVQL